MSEEALEDIGGICTVVMSLPLYVVEQQAQKRCTNQTSTQINQNPHVKLFQQSGCTLRKHLSFLSTVTAQIKNAKNILVIELIRETNYALFPLFIITALTLEIFHHSNIHICIIISTILLNELISTYWAFHSKSCSCYKITVFISEIVMKGEE